MSTSVRSLLYRAKQRLQKKLASSFKNIYTGRDFFRFPVSKGVKMKKDSIHEKIQRKRLLYLDHELPKKESELVRRHLRNCPYCSRMLEFHERSWKKLSSGEKVIPPPHLWEKLQNRLAVLDRVTGTSGCQGTQGDKG